MEDPLIGQSLNQYRIVRRLGQGGMGAVYEGQDSDTGRRVAIKVMIRTLREDPDVVKRFERESHIASQIHNDHVARVYDSGVANDVRYLVMEYIEGKPLMEILREKGRLAGSRPLEYIRQAAIGLDAALDHGIIHRDIKPDNMMVTEDGTLKLVDFGLAKGEKPDSFKTATGAVMGTPHYISPEQATGNAVDFRADIYSLGASFYQLLTGQPPFEGDTAIAIIQKHIATEPKAITHLNPNVPDSVCQVVYRMLRKHPDERFQTYGHLIRVLDDLIAGREAPSMTMEIVDEHAPRLADVEAHELERHRRNLMLISAAIVLLLVAVVVKILTRSPDSEESEFVGEDDPTGIVKKANEFKTETAPLLHDINKFMEEQDEDVDKFESRRSRMNRGDEN